MKTVPGINPLLDALPRCMHIASAVSGWLAEFPRQLVNSCYGSHHSAAPHGRCGWALTTSASQNGDGPRAGRLETEKRRRLGQPIVVTMSGSAHIAPLRAKIVE